MAPRVLCVGAAARLARRPAATPRAIGAAAGVGECNSISGGSAATLRPAPPPARDETSARSLSRRESRRGDAAPSLPLASAGSAAAKASAAWTCGARAHGRTAAAGRSHHSTRQRRAVSRRASVPMQTLRRRASRRAPAAEGIERTTAPRRRRRRRRRVTAARLRELSQPSAQPVGIAEVAWHAAACEETYEITAGSAAAALAVAASSRKRAARLRPSSRPAHYSRTPSIHRAHGRRRAASETAPADGSRSRGHPARASHRACTARQRPPSGPIPRSQQREPPAAAPHPPPPARPRRACTAPRRVRGVPRVVSGHGAPTPAAAQRRAQQLAADPTEPIGADATVSDEEGTRGARRRRQHEEPSAAE